MVQSKTKVKEHDTNGVGGAKKGSTKEVDHWDFLEEIEAPMWVDLTLEPMLMTQDQDDPWFHTSHPFHQRSARHLRSAFSHSNAGNDFFNFKLQGVSSPKLPSSVSKSRGKDYQSRNWGSNGRVSLNKDHPVNDLEGQTSSEESKLKGSSANQIGDSGSSSNLHSDNSCITTISYSSQDYQSTSEGVSTRTITTESGQQQHSKVLEVSKGACAHTHTGGLLGALKTNLRKSCATRPAMRVEICDERESRGRKSSSGKSSVGSSNNIGCGTKSKARAIMQKTDHQRQVKGEMNANRGSKSCNIFSAKSRSEVRQVDAGLKQSKDRNLNVRDLGKLAQPVKGRQKALDITKASFLTSKAYESKMEGQDTAAAPTAQKAPKLKVLTQMTQKISSNQPRVKSQGVKSKIGSSSQFNGLACSGKENMRGREVLSQRSDVKDQMPVVRVSDQKTSKKLENNVGRTTSVGPKGRTGRGNDSKLSKDAHACIR